MCPYGNPVYTAKISAATAYMPRIATSFAASRHPSHNFNAQNDGTAKSSTFIDDNTFAQRGISTLVIKTAPDASSTSTMAVKMLILEVFNILVKVLAAE